jgi:hypothetical protein
MRLSGDGLSYQSYHFRPSGRLEDSFMPGSEVNRLQAKWSLGELSMSRHAAIRISSRRLPSEAMEVVFCHGREIHTRGAVVFVVGRKEVDRAQRRGLDLTRFEGVHMVCSLKGVVLTAYGNSNLKALKPSTKHQYGRKRRQHGQ